MKITYLQNENDYLKKENTTKQTLIDMLITNNNNILITNNNNKQKSDDKFKFPKMTSKQKWPRGQEETFTPHNPPLILQNRFSSLGFDNCNHIEDEDVLESPVPYTRSYQNGILNQTKKKIYHNKGDGNFYDKHPERNINPFSKKTSKMTPGNNTYSRMTDKEKKVFVFSDSHGTRIRKKEFSAHVSNGTAKIKAFPGANAHHLRHYVIPSLEEKPDAVVIMVGANDIRSKESDEAIANEIIDVGRVCKQQGVNDVHICSLTSRSNENEMLRVRSINFILKSLCRGENISYICNDAITSDYLCSDGIHLIYKGTIILANNILDSINSNIIS